MGRLLRIAAAVVLSLSLVFAGVTWTALESSGVAILETRAAGGTRRTRVWFAEHEGALWLEAATPEREWLRDVRRSPLVILRRGARVEQREALVVQGDDAHGTIRELLRAKYGWRDRWVGLLQGTSESVAVRLVLQAVQRDEENG
jgi:hypothetical protein